MIIDKKVVIAMIEGDTPSYHVKDWMGINQLPNGSQVTQLILESGSDPEPFPGLTAELYKFVASDEVIGILGLMADTDRKVVNLLVAGAGDAPSGRKP